MINQNKNIADLLMDHAASKIELAMDDAVDFAKGIAPIDTSSYRLSIRRTNFSESGLARSAEVIAGGLDYSGQILSTGKEGKFVDYAIDIEARDGVMANSIGVLIASAD